jgi:hypothetical protein
VTTNGSDTPSGEPDPADRDLLERLASLQADTAPPPELTAWAQQSFMIRRLEAELAALVFDSDDDAFAVNPERELVSVRRSSPTGERRLMFESADDGLALELTLTTTGGRHRLEGHVLPTGELTVELWQGATPAPAPVNADPLGGFVVADVQPGPVRITCRRPGAGPVTSEWFLVG